MSWRFHTTLTRTKWNKVIILASKLKKKKKNWWRHFCLCSIEIISLTGHQFSPRFWYVVAETILYKKYLFFILMMSSQWNFRLKATMHNFSYLCVMSMGDHFVSKHESAWQCSLTSSPVVILQFAPKFQYVVAETISYWQCGLRFLIRCREHGQIFNSKLPFEIEENASWPLRVKSMGEICLVNQGFVVRAQSVPGWFFFFFLPAWKSIYMNIII